MNINSTKFKSSPCKNCKGENPPGARFCCYCGKALTAADPAPLSEFFKALLICLGYYVFFAFMQYVGVALFWGNRRFINEAAILSGVLTLVGYILLFTVIRKSFAKQIRLKKIHPRVLCSTAILGICLQVAVSIAMTLVHLFFLEGSSSDSATDAIFENGSLLLRILNITLVTGTVEEILFRGLIYTTLKNAMPTGFAVFLSSVIFGAAHGNIKQFIYTSVLGVLLALIFEKCDSILAPITVHAFFNGSTLLLQMLPFQGLMPYVTLAVFCAGVSLIILSFLFFTKKESCNSLNIIKE